MLILSGRNDAMALNYVWIAFFLVGLVIALFKLIFLQDYEIFKKLVDGIFDASKSSVMDVALPLTGVMVFFMGLMNIGEKAGAVNFLARLLNPFMKRLFPEVPEKHPAMGQMVMNFSANMLGLDNAATPFGLKAMESLQTLNPNKDTATNAQIMFLVLHTSGLTLIPLSIIAYRAGAGSVNPTSVFIPLMLATGVATIASIIITGLYQRLRFDAVLITWLGTLIVAIGLFALFMYRLPSEQKFTGASITETEFKQKVITSGGVTRLVLIEGEKDKMVKVFINPASMDKEYYRNAINLANYSSVTELNDHPAFQFPVNSFDSVKSWTGVNFPAAVILQDKKENWKTPLLSKEVFGNVLGNVILFVLISAFIVGGLIKRINVFDAFIEGAKGGWEVIVRIIPYLVGMLVAIRVFRDSGALTALINGISYALNAVGIGGDYVPALPVAIMRPFSGAGARGLMLDIFTNPAYGPDSFVGKLASTFQGSADTTFYILALYFGSVGIKKVRYAIWAGMMADLIGVIAAIGIGYLMLH
jgi:spore maturation protein SpmA